MSSYQLFCHVYRFTLLLFATAAIASYKLQPSHDEKCFAEALVIRVLDY